MSTHDRSEGEFSLTEPQSAPPGKGTPRRTKKDTETVSESSGGFLGAVSGLSVGAVGGPVGAVIGGIAGAVGGWWAGHGIAKAISDDDDDSFRSEYERAPIADRSYEQVRPAYVAGYLAGRNPDYAAQSFEDVEGDLKCGWGTDIVRHCGEWPAVRGYARSAFERARHADSAPEEG